MRETKFRFWMGNYAKPIYEYSDNLIRLEQERDCSILTDYLMTKRTEIVKEQYTDVSDKNDKEICEGDIVKQYWQEKGNAIIYMVGCFGYLDKYDNFHNLDNHQDLEIIGNIHENSELLKGV